MELALFGEGDRVRRRPLGRMLAAQAVVEGLTLVSKDGWIRGMGRRWCGLGFAPPMLHEH